MAGMPIISARISAYNPLRRYRPLLPPVLQISKLSAWQTSPWARSSPLIRVRTWKTPSSRRLELQERLPREPLLTLAPRLSLSAVRQASVPARPFSLTTVLLRRRRLLPPLAVAEEVAALPLISARRSRL